MLNASTIARKRTAPPKIAQPRRRGATNPAPIVVPDVDIASRDLAGADIHTLVKWQREAIAVVDKLPEPARGAEDSAQLTKAMSSVSTIFKIIKDLDLNSASDIALQMKIIGEVGGWFGGSGDQTMEDIGVVDFRRIAENLAASSQPIEPPTDRGRPDRLAALDLIDASIGPMGAEPDLMAEIRRLHADNNVWAMVCLLESYRDIAEAFLRFHNQPRARMATARRRSGTGLPGVQILEDEFAHAYSKAYLVAEHLKSMRFEDDTQKMVVAELLFSCAVMMGHGIFGAISVAQAIADMRTEQDCASAGKAVR